MTFHDLEDQDYVNAFQQAAPATVQLEANLQDRRSALIRTARFELNQRKDLKPAKPMRRLLELLEEVVELLEGER